jgi:DNA replication licensing factor MCM6
MEMDPDDEVVGARGGVAARLGRPRTDLSAVPKVTDEAGDQIMRAFVDFLEKCVLGTEC